MNAEKSRKDFKRMYDDLVDPEKQQERRQIAERTKRIEERKKDTGL